MTAAKERKAAAQNVKDTKKAAEKEAAESSEWASGAKSNKKEQEEQRRVGGGFVCHILQETLGGVLLRRLIKPLYVDSKSNWPRSARPSVPLRKKRRASRASHPSLLKERRYVSCLSSFPFVRYKSWIPEQEC